MKVPYVDVDDNRLFTKNCPTYQRDFIPSLRASSGPRPNQ